MWNAREKSEYFFRDILPEEYFTDEAVERRRREMKNIKKTNELVQRILLDYPDSRGSDDTLYRYVVEAINPDAANMPFCQVLLNRNEYGLPPYESVRRSRQKLQETYPMLRASKEVEEARAENEQEVRDYVSDCQWR